MVAKGVGSLMGGKSGQSGGGSVLGGLLGSLAGGGSSSAGGLGGLLGSLAGGSSSSAGGLGGLLGSLAGGGGSSSAGGLGGMLGSLLGGGSGSRSGGGMGDLGSLLGGGSAGRGASGGSMSDVLGSLLGGGGNTAAGSGGMGDLMGSLGGLLGGAAGTGNSGLGGMLDSLGGGAQTSPGSNSSFGELFNSALQGKEPQKIDPTDERKAELMLKAMINAAKSDGRLDEAEKRRLTENMTELSPQEREFVQRELQGPVDLKGLISSVPKGMEQQVYFMSLLGIDLDTQEEAQYLDQLARGLGLSADQVNQIHDQLNVPHLYS
ncbi:MAG: tellurite resistance TerB family protein [Thiothrix sp.]|nr:tellurite resistance TerB family protein [Thiothrix sp.]